MVRSFGRVPFAGPPPLRPAGCTARPDRRLSAAHDIRLTATSG